MSDNIYSFNAVNMQGKEISLAEYKGAKWGRMQFMQLIERELR
jgi:hypothetical protein